MPLLSQPQRGLQALLLLLLPRCGGARVGLADVQELGQRLVHQAALVLQVAAGYQVPLGMAAQPPLTEPQQLLHLLVTDPVMLLVVQDRQKNVEVGQQVPETAFRL